MTRDGHPIIFHDDYIILEDKVLPTTWSLCCRKKALSSTDVYRKITEMRQDVTSFITIHSKRLAISYAAAVQCRCRGRLGSFH